MPEEMKEEYQVCYKHPDRKTYLRCNKCGRPICLDCAVQTPTGFRCKDCIKEQQKVFDTSEKKDYIIGGAIAAILGFIGALIEQEIRILPTFITALIAGYAFGKLICFIVRRAVSKRRSRKLTTIVTIAAGAGALLQCLDYLAFSIPLLFSGGIAWVISGLVDIVPQILYIIVLCSTIQMDFNGMVFGR